MILSQPVRVAGCNGTMPDYGVTNMNTYDVEFTDTYAGEANYSWVRRAKIHMPELTHYGYDGSTNYGKANRIAERELTKKAKAAVGLTGVRGTKFNCGDTIEFRPHRSCTVMFVTFTDLD